MFQSGSIIGIIRLLSMSGAAIESSSQKVGGAEQRIRKQDYTCAKAAEARRERTGNTGEKMTERQQRTIKELRLKLRGGVERKEDMRCL